jgi:amino acid permease
MEHSTDPKFEPLLGEPPSAFTEEMGPSQPHADLSRFRAFVVLMNTVIGVGLLGIPFCFRAGILMNFLLISIIGGASFFSFIVLIDVSLTTGQPIDFARFMRASFAFNLDWIPHLLLSITFFGFAILHLQSAGSLISSCLAEIPGTPKWCFSRWFLICTPGIVIGLPLILLRSIRGFSHVSMATCLLIALYVVHSAVYLGINVCAFGFDPNHELIWFSFNEFVIPALSIQAFAYACHPLIGVTLARLIQPTRSRQYSTMAMMVVCASLCYVLGGLLPYLTLFDNIRDPVVFVYYPKGQLFTIIAKGLYAVFLVFTTPLILYSARLGFNDLVFRNEFTTIRWRVMGICTLAATIILAVTVESIATMFEFIGGFTCNLIVYIMPALYYVRICKGESQVKTVIAYVMFPLGLVSTVDCLYESIHSLVTKQ